jgi:putative endonuclease
MCIYMYICAVPTAHIWMYSVYLLVNGTGGTYIGYTSKPVDHRLKLHNSGRGGRFTKTRRPWHIVAVLTGFPTRRYALRYEYFSKRTSGRARGKILPVLAKKINQLIHTINRVDFDTLTLMLSIVNQYSVQLQKFIPPHPRITIRYGDEAT